MQTYTQCLLRKTLGGSFCEYVVWVPSSLAKIGKTLLPESHPGEWKVVGRYSTMDFTAADAKSRDHLKQRQASDV